MLQLQTTCKFAVPPRIRIISSVGALELTLGCTIDTSKVVGKIRI